MALYGLTVLGFCRRLEGRGLVGLADVVADSGAVLCCLEIGAEGC